MAGKPRLVAGAAPPEPGTAQIQIPCYYSRVGTVAAEMVRKTAAAVETDSFAVAGKLDRMAEVGQRIEVVAVQG